MKEFEELEVGDVLYGYVYCGYSRQYDWMSGGWHHCLCPDLMDDVIIFKVTITEKKQHNPYKMHTPYITFRLEEKILRDREWGKLKSPFQLVISRNTAQNTHEAVCVYDNTTPIEGGDWERTCHLFTSKEEMQKFVNGDMKRELIENWMKEFQKVDEHFKEI